MPSSSFFSPALALSLLVLLVLANHPHDAFTLDDLALVANLFDTGSDFHFSRSPATWADANLGRESF